MKTSVKSPAADAPVVPTSVLSSDEAIKALIIDATVALESLLYPEFADTSVDPHEVNDRLLAWADKHLDWSSPRFDEAAKVLGGQ